LQKSETDCIVLHFAIIIFIVVLDIFLKAPQSASDLIYCSFQTNLTCLNYIVWPSLESLKKQEVLLCLLCKVVARTQVQCVNFTAIMNFETNICPVVDRASSSVPHTL